MATSFEFDLPRGFGPIPLDPSPDDRAERARRLLAHLPEEALPERAKAVDGLVMGGELMLQAGARVAGQFTLDDEEPDVTASFMLAVHDLPGAAQLDEHGSTYLFMATIGDELRERRPDHDIRGRDFECGPGLVAVKAGEYRIPAERVTTGESVSAPSYGLQIMLPDPDGDRLIVLDVSTHHIRHWARFVEQGFSVANSISFAQPSEAESPDGA